MSLYFEYLRRKPKKQSPPTRSSSNKSVTMMETFLASVFTSFGGNGRLINKGQAVSIIEVNPVKLEVSVSELATRRNIVICEDVDQ
ncbi:hypothetical protein IEQ34_015917 [Dendrobium chrysotoxum]|uniref:Uncharacterized protein n=1 Tax=Dendrobium chrysotoxum TaxID=161865 RepID=A0AAV7GJA4_DENCH|nr:hypothetical protein IEQ34_015917 [Dendrobium chrysotoxum]